MSRLHDLTISASNGLITVAGWFEDHGHPAAYGRVIAFRGWFDRSVCKVFRHPRVIYGAMRDICLDCLTVIDEHPNGRGRRAATREGGESR